MIIYEEKQLAEHPVIHGAYLTIMGDVDKYGRPKVVDYLIHHRQDWVSIYHSAYMRLKLNQSLNFQLLNYAYVPFEHIPNTPSHLLAMYYEDIDAINDDSAKFRRVLAETLGCFNNIHTMPLYIPYRIDNVVSDEVWNDVVLPMVVSLYGKDEVKHSVIMPSIVTLRRRRM